MTHDFSAGPGHGSAPRHIALLGAAGSGKTRLAGELVAALNPGPLPRPALVVADNPPLAAVLSARVDGLPEFDQVLLMGLDLALSAPAGFAATQEAHDQQLRLTLANAEVPYSVVYGQGPKRLAHALSALQTLLAGGKPTARMVDDQERKHWVWACNTCSDPGCERRLLSDLLARQSC